MQYSASFFDWSSMKYVSPIISWRNEQNILHAITQEVNPNILVESFCDTYADENEKESELSFN